MGGWVGGGYGGKVIMFGMGVRGRRGGREKGRGGDGRNWLDFISA